MTPAWPIKIRTLKQAIKREMSFLKLARGAGIVGQLAFSLRVYTERDEYNRTLQSAMECLERAGYEFENVGVK